MKRAFFVIVIVVTVLCYAGLVFAGDFTWTNNVDNTCTITGHTDPVGALTIPSTLDELPTEVYYYPGDIAGSYGVDMEDFSSLSASWTGSSTDMEVLIEIAKHWLEGKLPITDPTIANVYLAQTHVQSPEDALFKLVGNRPAFLKVHVVAPGGGYAPEVRAVISVGDETTTLTLKGPAQLPESFEASPGLVQHRHDDSFTGLIPAQWVRPGLKISVEAANSTAEYDIKVGAPTIAKIHMYDIHFFSGGASSDYPAGTFEEIESKWPVSDLVVERVKNINFPELVARAQNGAPFVRVSSTADYQSQTGISFGDSRLIAFDWAEALLASGGNTNKAIQFINVLGAYISGGAANTFKGVGNMSHGILSHELGHTLGLPHWGDYYSYPYKGTMYGIEPQPGVSNGTHVGPTWGFDLRTSTYIPPTVQLTTVGSQDLVGYYKKSPMQGGGTGDQESDFLLRHFSDYAVYRMQNTLEAKVPILKEDGYYKWSNEENDYTIKITNNGVSYPIEEDVQVYSVMAAVTLSDMNVNMVYTPIGPYKGNLIRTFDPTVEQDRLDMASSFRPMAGCDFCLRIVQGGVTKNYMLRASGLAGDTTNNNFLKTVAINIPARNGEITKVELLLTPDVERNGLPGSPQVLYTWTE